VQAYLKKLFSKEMKPNSDSQKTELRDSGREKKQPKFDKVATIKSQSGDIFTG